MLQGFGALGPVESQVRVARVCGKTSAAARLISRGKAPGRSPNIPLPALNHFSRPDSIRHENSCAYFETFAAHVERCLAGSALADQCSRCRAVSFDPCGSYTTVVEHTYTVDDDNNNMTNKGQGYYHPKAEIRSS